MNDRRDENPPGEPEDDASLEISDDELAQISGGVRGLRSTAKRVGAKRVSKRRRVVLREDPENLG